MSGLVQSRDGNLYGAASAGGAFGFGTLFKVGLDGAMQTLVDFTDQVGVNKGGEPSSALLLGSDGCMYGTANAGGSANAGTIYKMTLGGVLTTLIEFTGNGSSTRGNSPSGALLQGSDGSFYGTTKNGGALGFGTLFKLSPVGDLTTIAEFSNNGPMNRGSYPDTQLVVGSDGAILGTTTAGGAFDFGTIFRLSAGNVLTTIVDFTGGTGIGKGTNPIGLLRARDGSLCGTTYGGGSFGYGTAFKITPAGDFLTLVEFTGDAGENRGSYPDGGLAEASNGDLYGTTSGGGSFRNGTVFKIPPTAPW